MAEPSPEPRFTRGRLVVGVVLVAVVVAAGVVAATRLLGSDEAMLAYIRAGELVLDTLDGDSRTFALPSDLPSPALSPDGRMLAYGDERVTVLDLRDGNEIEGPDGRVVGWTPEGHVVVERPGVEDRTFLARWDLESEPVPIVVLGLGSHVGEPVWLGPDLFTIALPPRAGGDPTTYVTSVSAGTVVAVHTFPNAVPLAAAPGGTELLYGVPGGEVVATHPDGSNARDVGLAGDFTSAAVSQGGLVAISGRTTDDVAGTWVLAAGGDEPVRVSADPATAMGWLDESTLAIVTDAGVLVTLSLPEVAETPIATDVLPGFLAVLR